MDNKVYEKLRNKKLIDIDSEVSVVHTVKDFGQSTFDKEDMYNVVGINKNKLLGTSTVDGSELSFTPEQITMIDGMEPKRLCDAYKIKV